MQGSLRHTALAVPVAIDHAVSEALCTVHLCCRVEAGTVDTILSYCHNSLNDTSLLDLVPYLQQKGVGIISASPMSMGLLTTKVTSLLADAGQPVLLACAKEDSVACAQMSATLPVLQYKGVDDTSVKDD